MADQDNGNDMFQDVEGFEPEMRQMRGGFRRNMRRKSCALCRDKVDIIDFKDTKFLMPFIPERGKIMPRRISGNCATHQRMLAEAIKRARNIALIPYVTA
jgi:small subunit ribosomal protein S18